MLGSNQLDWLKKLLKEDSKEQWNLLGIQSLFGQMNFSSKEPQRFWNDSWDGYPAERKVVIDALIQTEPKNLVIFGGDLHENWVGYVKADYSDPDSKVLGVEFCGTSISAKTVGTKNVPALLKINPHFIFGDTLQRGYGVVQVTPKEMSVVLKVVGTQSKDSPTAEILASFKIVSGSKSIIRTG